MATIKYSKLVELVRNNPEYIEYDGDIDPKAHFVILFDKTTKEKDITEVEIVEGHLIMETQYNTVEMSIGDNNLLRMIEFR